MFCLEGPPADAVRAPPSSAKSAHAPPVAARLRRAHRVRRAEDASDRPRSALPRSPLGQPDDPTTRACERLTGSVRPGPRRAVRVVAASRARWPSSAVATHVLLPSLGGRAEEFFDATGLVFRLLELERRARRLTVRAFAQSRSPTGGRRGTDGGVRALESALRADRSLGLRAHARALGALRSLGGMAVPRSLTAERRGTDDARESEAAGYQARSRPESLPLALSLGSREPRRHQPAEARPRVPPPGTLPARPLLF